MKARYSVVNVYGLGTTSHHKTPEIAIKAANERGGVGRLVVDQRERVWQEDDEGNVNVVAELKPTKSKKKGIIKE